MADVARSDLNSHPIRFRRPEGEPLLAIRTPGRVSFLPSGPTDEVPLIIETRHRDNIHCFNGRAGVDETIGLILCTSRTYFHSRPVTGNICHQNTRLNLLRLSPVSMIYLNMYGINDLRNIRNMPNSESSPWFLLPDQHRTNLRSVSSLEALFTSTIPRAPSFTRNRCYVGPGSRIWHTLNRVNRRANHQTQQRTKNHF